jgi:hypothetical protein
MTRRVRLTWPDRRPFENREAGPIRILAASDEPDPALEYAPNREAIGPIDLVVGCGDLEPHWLDFLAHAFSTPLVFVTGNHDRGPTWEAGQAGLPTAGAGGSVTSVVGLDVALLPWPGRRDRGNVRDEGRAWRQALSIAGRRLVARLRGRSRPLLIVSHAPPAGAGDAPDAYHLGFRAYRWLLDRFGPPLWLHGHVTTASVPALTVVVGRTTLINVTGSVLVELEPPA